MPDGTAIVAVIASQLLAAAAAAQVTQTQSLSFLAQPSAHEAHGSGASVSLSFAGGLPPGFLSFGELQSLGLVPQGASLVRADIGVDFFAGAPLRVHFRQPLETDFVGIEHQAQVGLRGAGIDVLWPSWGADYFEVPEHGWWSMDRQFLVMASVTDPHALAAYASGEPSLDFWFTISAQALDGLQQPLAGAESLAWSLELMPLLTVHYTYVVPAPPTLAALLALPLVRRRR